MTGVDREEVRRVARLARLELSEEEAERLAEAMRQVLARFSELEAAEEERADDGRPDAASAGAAAPREAAGSSLRPDRPDPDRLSRSPADLAPAWEDGHFVVPRLEALGDGEGREGDGAPGTEGGLPEGGARGNR